MYKSTISIISICLLSACGSGSSDEPVNPFSPVAEQADSQSPEQIQSDPITATVEQTIVEPIVQPVQQPIVQPAPVRGPCVDTAPVNDGFGWDGVGTCLTPIVATVEPEPVSQPVIIPIETPMENLRPEFTNPFTGEDVVLVPANFTEEDFFMNGRLWECVEAEYGLIGDAWAFKPGSKGAAHYDGGTSDLFDNVNANISSGAAGLPWSIMNGVYFGPLPLHGVQWVEFRGEKGYSIWHTDYTRTDCFERAN